MLLLLVPGLGMGAASGVPAAPTTGDILLIWQA